MMICPDCALALSETDLLRCSTCDWQGEMREGIPVYLSRRDRKDPTLKEYLENYRRLSDDDLEKSILDERYIENQAANLASCVGNLEGTEVCDLGTGKGLLAKALLARGAKRVTVIDISLSYLDRLREVPNIRPILANAENLPFFETFDVVVSTDVMEHVLNVGSFLFALNLEVKKGGVVYIRVPYRESLLRYSTHLGCSYRFVHLRSFNKDTLRIYLEDAGFVIKEFRLDGFNLSTPRKFWMSTGKRSAWYSFFQSTVTRWLSHPTNVTLWNSRLAGLFMPPLEIIAIARKQSRIDKLPNGGFTLTPL